MTFEETPSGHQPLVGMLRLTPYMNKLAPGDGMCRLKKIKKESVRSRSTKCTIHVCTYLLEYQIVCPRSFRLELNDSIPYGENRWVNGPGG